MQRRETGCRRPSPPESFPSKRMANWMDAQLSARFHDHLFDHEPDHLLVAGEVRILQPLAHMVAERLQGVQALRLLAASGGGIGQDAVAVGNAATDQGTLADPILPAPTCASSDHPPLEVGDGPKHVLQQLALGAVAGRVLDKLDPDPLAQLPQQ